MRAWTAIDHRTTQTWFTHAAVAWPHGLTTHSRIESASVIGAPDVHGPHGPAWQSPSAAHFTGASLAGGGAESVGLQAAIASVANANETMIVFTTAPSLPCR
jgi:hypothetical protein